MEVVRALCVKLLAKLILVLKLIALHWFHFIERRLRSVESYVSSSKSDAWRFRKTRLARVEIRIDPDGSGVTFAGKDCLSQLRPW